jgi:hypothetical protein
VKKINPEEIRNWAIIGLGAYLVFKFFKPLDTLLSIPGNIIEGASNVINRATAAVKEAAKPLPPAERPGPVSTPGLSTQQLARRVDKEIRAKVDGTPIRKTANSNAAWNGVYNSGQRIGYIFSAVNEKIGTQNKTWLMVHNAPGSSGRLIGYVPLNDVNIIGASINGILA